MPLKPPKCFLRKYDFDNNKFRFIIEGYSNLKDLTHFWPHSDILTHSVLKVVLLVPFHDKKSQVNRRVMNDIHHGSVPCSVAEYFQ